MKFLALIEKSDAREEKEHNDRVNAAKRQEEFAEQERKVKIARATVPTMPKEQFVSFCSRAPTKLLAAVFDVIPDSLKQHIPLQVQENINKYLYEGF